MESVIDTQFVNLPPEVICIILANNNLDITDLRKFRLVCLGNQYLHNNLYQIITNDIVKRDTLRILLDDRNVVECKKFVRDFDFLIKSEFKIKVDLRLIYEHALSQNESWKSRIIDMFDMCHQRISQIYVDCFYAGADLLEMILPKLKHVEMLDITSRLGAHHSFLFHNLVNTNSSGLKNLNLRNMTITDFQFNAMSNLTEMKLIDCKGNTGIHTLLSKATNLKKLSLKYMNVNALVISTCKNLQELELVNCQGEISTLINQSAKSLISLVLFDTDLNSVITEPLTNLKNLKLEGCRGEISSLFRQAAPKVCSLELNWIDMETQVERFNNLQSVYIQNRKIDVSHCVLLAREGTLKEFIK